MAQITVNGRTYEMVERIKVGEARRMQQLYGFAIDPESERTGFDMASVCSVIHIAISRAEPGESDRTIQAVVDELDIEELNAVFMDMSVEVDDLPPPNADAVSSPSVGSGETSSTPSEPSPENSQANGSGSPGLDTGVISDPWMSTI